MPLDLQRGPAVLGPQLVPLVAVVLGDLGLAASDGQMAIDEGMRAATAARRRSWSWKSRLSWIRSAGISRSATRRSCHASKGALE